MFNLLPTQFNLTFPEKTATHAIYTRFAIVPKIIRFLIFYFVISIFILLLLFIFIVFSVLFFDPMYGSHAIGPAIDALVMISTNTEFTNWVFEQISALKENRQSRNKNSAETTTRSDVEHLTRSQEPKAESSCESGISISSGSSSGSSSGGSSGSSSESSSESPSGSSVVVHSELTE